MTETIETKVEIDERIRQRPELLEAVKDATEYVEKYAVDVPPAAQIRWRFADPDGKKIEISLADHVGTETKSVSRTFWTRWILDPTNRRLCVLDVWGDLLYTRSDRHQARIDELMSRLTEEEANGREDAE